MISTASEATAAIGMNPAGRAMTYRRLRSLTTRITQTQGYHTAERNAD